MTVQTRPILSSQMLETIVAYPSSAGGLYDRVFKRALDILAVLVCAVPVLFVLLILAAAIAMDGVNPFYRQRRIGRNGNIFHMWKLRSMVKDADRLLDVYLAENPQARAEWDDKQKLKHDPRITPIGRIIRRTSLDELPQLWNVLIGEMSLVGPRPMMENQRELYPGDSYYTMRPGITGYWQTAERNECSFSERSGYDTAYSRDLSFWTDLRILLRTVGVVTKGTGC